MYKKGNLFFNLPKSPAIIAHVCNDIGVFGGGFTRNFTKEQAIPYHALQRAHGGRSLGMVAYANYNEQIRIAHMIAQSGINALVYIDRVDYTALDKCLSEVGQLDLPVLLPRICMGLAGAKDWNRIERLLNKSLKEWTVYDL